MIRLIIDRIRKSVWTLPEVKFCDYVALPPLTTRDRPGESLTRQPLGGNILQDCAIMKVVGDTTNNLFPFRPQLCAPINGFAWIMRCLQALRPIVIAGVCGHDCGALIKDGGALINCGD